MQRLVKLSAYLICFGLARSSLFIAPIVLANLLAPADYGSLELAQAIGSVGAQVLALGTGALVPLVLVRKLSTVSWRAILWHQLMICTGLAIFAVIAINLETSTAIWLAALATAVLMLQALWSVVLKSLGRAEGALMLEAGFWGGLAIAVWGASMLAVSMAARANWAHGVLALYGFALLLWTAWRWRLATPTPAGLLYTPTLRAGIPLLIASLLALLVTTSGRLALGLASTPETLADYSVLFRATALPVVAHQIVLTAIFRRVFESPMATLQRQLSVIIAGVTLMVILFWVLSDYAASLLGPAFARAFTQYPKEGLLILIQCILWSAIALNDAVNSRSQTAAHVSRASAIYLLISFSLMWWYFSQKPITLTAFVPAHSLTMVGYFLIQVWAMRRQGINLSSTWVLAFGAFTVLSVLAWFV